MTFTITKLDRPIHSGDWHDRPLRHQVTGPEIQNFSTKKEALRWCSIRRKASSFSDALSKFVSL